MRARWDARRVGDYFRDHVRAGRAVLSGTLFDPDAWVTQPDPDRNVFCVCWARRDDLLMVPGTMSLLSTYRLSRLKVH